MYLQLLTCVRNEDTLVGYRFDWWQKSRTIVWFFFLLFYRSYLSNVKWKITPIVVAFSENLNIKHRIFFNYWRKKNKKYKSKTGTLLVIFLSCPQIGSLSSSTANQGTAQNNYQACQSLYFLNFVTCKVGWNLKNWCNVT